MSGLPDTDHAIVTSDEYTALTLLPVEDQTCVLTVASNQVVERA